MARCGVRVTQHSEYCMQMIVTAETGMTMMGGGDRRCCEKICLNQPSLFLNLQIIHFDILIESSTQIQSTGGDVQCAVPLEMRPYESV